jgi:hypothetical protein
MRLSQFHLRTTKETHADAEVVSHQLMLRAGMIRKLASGLYTWSPLGLRVLRNHDFSANLVQIGAEIDTAAIDAVTPPQLRRADRTVKLGIEASRQALTEARCLPGAAGLGRPASTGSGCAEGECGDHAALAAGEGAHVPAVQRA